MQGMKYYRILGWASLLLTALKLAAFTTLVVSAYTIFTAGKSTIENGRYGLNVSTKGRIEVIAWFEIENKGLLPVNVSLEVGVENKILNLSLYNASSTLIEPGRSRILSVGVPLYNESYLFMLPTSKYKLKVKLSAPFNLVSVSVTAETGDNDESTAENETRHLKSPSLPPGGLIFQPVWILFCLEIPDTPSHLKDEGKRQRSWRTARGNRLTHILHAISILIAGWIALYLLVAAPQWLRETLEASHLQMESLRLNILLFTLLLSSLHILEALQASRLLHHLINIARSALQLYMILYCLGLGSPLNLGLSTLKFYMKARITFELNLRPFAKTFIWLYAGSILAETSKMLLNSRDGGCPI